MRRDSSNCQRDNYRGTSSLCGLPNKTAWFMTHRICEAMKSGRSPFGGPGKVVEVDETYFGNDTGQKRVRVKTHATGQRNGK